MTRVVLDIARPITSLREAAGLTQASFARLRGVKPSSQHEAEGLGPRINLATLLEAAARAGLTVEIVVEKKST